MTYIGTAIFNFVPQKAAGGNCALFAVLAFVGQAAEEPGNRQLKCLAERKGENMWSFLAKIAGAGARVVNWARGNWSTVQKWIDAGKSIDWIIQRIISILGG